MTLFAVLAFLMLARSLVPRFGEMLIAAATPAAVRDKHPLARRSQVRDGLICFRVVYHCPYRNEQHHVVAGLPAAIGTFAVTATVRFELTVVAVTQQGVVVTVGFQINTGAMAAVATGRPATRPIRSAARPPPALGPVGP